MNIAGGPALFLAGIFSRRYAYKHFVCTLVVIGFLQPVSSQSIQELQRLKAEYEKFQKEQRQQVGTTQMETVDLETGLPKQAIISPMIQEDFDVSEAVGIQHFGYDFFTQRDKVPFWENLPTPANYLLGPGDELVVSLWGETQLRQTYTINREGKIYDSKVGLLNITGKTITDARQYLKDQFGRVYATLKGNSPTTFMDVSLGELRSINVNFVGQVNFPGVYPIHPFSTVITGLIQAGGVGTPGSLRNIQIKRNGALLSSVDLYDYFLKGEIPGNIQLRDQDMVVIPVRESEVKVESAVVNPGIYESKDGESVYDLIQYAGGLKPDASEKVGLKRIIPIEKRENGIAFEGHYIDLNSAKLIAAQNGDQILVRHLFEEKQQVEIIGQVKVPGIYHYHEGMTFKDLTALGGGFEDTTFWKSVYHDRAEIIRRNPDIQYEKVIEVNLGEVFNGNGSKDIPLQNLDRVVIHANRNYFERENIQILGEVNIPGSYPIINDNESLKSLISRAGGKIKGRTMMNYGSSILDFFLGCFDDAGQRFKNRMNTIK
ncbi:SLBB domain-containing protein [Caldithrix abyssi]|nr:SLBB domain-containing protein [Caldithrix abyssi]